MLVLPVDEDAWGFRACLAVGLALLVLDVVLPRVFRRRVRLLWPLRVPRRLALPRARPLTDDAFRRRKRELERQVRALERRGDGDESEAHGGATTESDGATGDDRRAHRLKHKTKVAKKKKKTRSRVVLPGDKTETEAEQSDVRSHVRKRVSFDMSPSELDQSRAESTRPTRHYEDEETKQSDAHQEETSQRHDQSVAKRTAASPVAQQPTTATAAQLTTEPASRPDPFSLVDDDFPWQLPNYARTSTTPAASPAPSSSFGAATSFEQPSSFVPKSLSPIAPHPAPLNLRRPLSHFNGTTTVSVPSLSSLSEETSSLELQRKPFWKRTPSKERDPSPAKQPARSSPMFHAGTAVPFATSIASAPQSSSSFGTSSVGSTTVSTDVSATDAPRLLFRPDPALRPSPVPMRTKPNPFLSKSWRVPSPKPPLHSRPTAATSTSRISTPVAPQLRMRTPKIIRRITFDDDMMGALASPADGTPLITESTRKRQRENDVVEALDAVGIPWHKRRL